MTVERTSRKAGEQVFSLYLRGLHPELFTIYDEREIFRDCYSAEIWITASSHVVGFMAGDKTLTEVLADSGQELPVQHRLHSVRLGANAPRTFRYDDGIAVDAQFDLRAYDRAGFLAKVREIRHAMLPDGVLHVFDPDVAGLPALTAVGFIPRHRSLNVRTYHTFPEDLTVIETHSRWDVRQAD